MIEVQDIFKEYGADFLKQYVFNYVQHKAFHDILNCRTAALGGHVDTCDDCGYQAISYNSCRNRHCPKCQTLKKEQWIEKQEQSLLNTQYFHVVFTIPSELKPIMYQNQTVMYNLFFKAVSETFLELSKNKKYLGAQLGVTAIMHTWGQNLLYHPHIHCIVPGGGLTADGKWRNSRKKFFIPVKVLSKKFRGKFMAYFRQAKLNYFGKMEDLNAPANFSSFVSGLYQKNWVTYCKPPFENAGKVVKYLGRYTHRVAISNNRLLKMENGYITFKWRDYADGNKSKEMTITALEFIRRFMMHILPSGFHKIRHFGILASKDKSARISLCKKLTNTPVISVCLLRKPLEILRDILGDKFNKCPRCGVGYLTRASPDAAIA
jgi:predicted Zn-ribbon and HTH transcriptional regulator